MGTLLALGRVLPSMLKLGTLGLRHAAVLDPRLPAWCQRSGANRWRPRQVALALCVAHFWVQAFVCGVDAQTKLLVVAKAVGDRSVASLKLRALVHATSAERTWPQGV